jgi:hypothetical protein
MYVSVSDDYCQRWGYQALSATQDGWLKTPTNKRKRLLDIMPSVHAYREHGLAVKRNDLVDYSKLMRFLGRMGGVVAQCQHRDFQIKIFDLRGLSTEFGYYPIKYRSALSTVELSGYAANPSFRARYRRATCSNGCK